MRLTHISLRNVRGLTVSTACAPGTPLVVTGPAVSGKTTFLEAIVAAKEAAGAYGTPGRPEDFRGLGDAGQVSLSLENVADHGSPSVTRFAIDWSLAAKAPQDLTTSTVAARLREFSVSPDVWKMEYFHSERTIGDVGVERTEGAMRLTKHPTKYGFIRRYLEDLVHEEAAGALRSLRADGVAVAEPGDRPGSRFTYALSVLAPTLRWDGCERHESSPQSWNGSWHESWKSWFIRPAGPRVELGALAGSEKAAVLVAASWAGLGLDRALVLVDHPEAGLHPSQHVAFFEGLAALMVRGQLIVTTTSPAILRAVPRSQVVVLGGVGADPH